MLTIRQDDLTHPQTRALVEFHQRGMAATSPPEHCFALDVSGLQGPGVTLWSAWDGDAIAGIGALKLLGGGGAELKSMRTHPDHLRKGVGAAVLEHIIGEARRRGVTRLSLETGSGEAFEPALELYRRRGFVSGAAFADYVGSDFNQFMHMDLEPA